MEGCLMVNEEVLSDPLVHACVNVPDQLTVDRWLKGGDVMGLLIHH